MTRFQTFTAAAFALGVMSAALPSAAQDISYPRVVGTGENAMVEYGPAGQQNLVGGGPVTVRDEQNGDVMLSYPDNGYVQPGRRGVQAVTVGQGESQRTIWVPAGNVARARLSGGGFQG